MSGILAPKTPKVETKPIEEVAKPAPLELNDAAKDKKNQAGKSLTRRFTFQTPTTDVGGINIPRG